ncbi:MAG: arsenate reductase (glutaredoxin) [Gammaproteobacteria bacterium]
MTIEIYHNPSCSKSRQALQLLRDRNIEPRIIAYLETPPNAGELRALLRKLGLRPTDIMRTGEATFKDARDEIGAMSDDARLQWLAAHPEVIQRPIVVNGERARIGRPPESVLGLLPR